MQVKDYYKILGVSEDVSDEELKKAFRTKSKMYHPDVSDKPQSEQQFQLIVEAYDVLSDPNSREIFDNFLKSTRENSYYRPNKGYSHRTHSNQTADRSAPYHHRSVYKQTGNTFNKMILAGIILWIAYYAVQNLYSLITDVPGESSITFNQTRAVLDEVRVDSRVRDYETEYLVRSVYSYTTDEGDNYWYTPILAVHTNYEDAKWVAESIRPDSVINYYYATEYPHVLRSEPQFIEDSENYNNDDRIFLLVVQLFFLGLFFLVYLAQG